MYQSISGYYVFNSSQVMADDGSVTDGWFYFVLFKVIVPALFGIISVTGITGNALVVYVILSKRQMRTVTNLLLLNLAFADLCFVIVIPPFTAYEYSTENWKLGRLACRLMHYLINVTAYVTVYTLVLVSAVRYMTVVHGVRTARLRTVTNVAIIIAAIWIIMILVNIPIWTAYDVGITEKCELPTVMNTGRYIFATFFMFAYLVPLSVIAVFSLCILRYISRHRGPVTVAAAADNTRTSAKKRQASRLLVLVVVIFAVLWLPLHIHLLVFYFGNTSDSPFYLVLSVLWNCLAYANSCVNPLIYDHMSKDFRDAFREVMRCSSSAAGAQRVEMEFHHRRHELQDVEQVSDALAARNIVSVHDEIELHNRITPQQSPN